MKSLLKTILDLVNILATMLSNNEIDFDSACHYVI